MSPHGRCDPRFAAVRDAFVRNFQLHDELGASVAVVADGRVVVDLYAGWADEARTRPWREDTLVNVFSVGKGVASLALLALASRGLVGLDDAVAAHWPGFGAADKGAITVRQLLSHRAGLPAVRAPLADDAIYRWDTMAGALAAERPWWKPGTRHGYHVNTFGWLVGELVRRLSGTSVGTFVARELAGPLGADFHLGLPDDEHARVADFVWNPALERPPTPDLDALGDDARMWWNAHFNPPGLSGHGVVNTAAWRRAEIPSTNPHATALGIARLYGLMTGGGAADGRSVVAAELVREASREQAAGVDAILHRPTRFGLGFQLPSKEKPIAPNDGVVLHFGAGGSLGLADPVARVSLGYARNRMGPRHDNPAPRALVAALYGSLG